MKVDVSRGEKKTGLVFKKTVQTVTVTVQFTEEEKKVIELTNIRNHIVAERPMRAGVNGNPDDDIWHLRVRHLLDGKPDVYEFNDLAAANSYYEAIVPSLKNLKAFIQENGKDTPDVSVEL